MKSSAINRNNLYENYMSKISIKFAKGQWVNSLGPEQNNGLFAGIIFYCSIWMKIIIVLMQIKFAPKGPVDIKSALVLVMA